MPYVKMSHLIWATKRRRSLISKQLKPLLIAHIKNNCAEKGIYLDAINCVEDHIHLLVSLKATQTIANVVKLIKGESSNWVNKQQIINERFEWQRAYFALSVCESAIKHVRRYIADQEAHNARKTSKSEHDLLLKIHGFKVGDIIPTNSADQ